MNKEINKEPTDEDIKEWSEGNKHLERLLIACRENGVPSMFCCAGHSNKEPAYVVFKMNKQTIGKIYSIVNSLNDINNIALTFTRNPLFSDSKFGVYMYDENEKNMVIDYMTEATTTEEKIENLPENFRKMVEVAELLIDEKFNFDLSYYKGKERKIYFRNFILEDTKYPFNRKIGKMGFTLIENGANNHYFIDGITEDKEHNVWEKVLDGMKNICAGVNKSKKEDISDEYKQRKRFEEMISNNGKYKRISGIVSNIKDNKSVKKTQDKSI